MSLITIVIWVAGVLPIAVTVLPLWRTDARWVRVWDFPRLQIAVLLIVVFVAAAGFLESQPWNWTFMALMLASLLWQVSRILPFLPVYPIQAKASEHCAPDASLTIITSNILIENRDAESILGMIRARRPDVVLLIETDDWWDSQLRGLEKDYPFFLRHPKPNAYGMHLYSRLPLIDPQVRYQVEDDVPSIKSRLRLRCGVEVMLYCLHPKPPPQSDTADRDAELILTAREIKGDKRPTIVIGDMNDVAWSRTTHLFQKISGLLDPRIGRGMFSTFHAHWRFLRWPVDHVFFEKSFLLSDLVVLPAVGSDHFPLYVALCFQPETGERQESPEASADDREQAHDIVEKAEEKD